MRSHMIRTVLLVGLVAALGAAAAAGSGSSPPGAGGRTHGTSLGTVLVSARGRTLYLFERDARGVSSCYAKCAAVWAPLLTSAQPVAGLGVRAALLGTTERRDGR